MVEFNNANIYRLRFITWATTNNEERMGNMNVLRDLLLKLYEAAICPLEYLRVDQWRREETQKIQETKVKYAPG